MRLSKFRRTRLETLEPRQMLDSTVVFNEIMYHAPGAAGDLEWIELHNQMAVDMDLSGWSIADGVGYSFPDGTVLPGFGYLVIALSPTVLEAATGFADALGPFTGRLDNGGERLELRNNNDRLMDALRYDDEGEWSTAPDGSGATLAKIEPDSASRPAANWTVSEQVHGTPGAENFPGGPPAASIVINEMSSGGAALFSIELANLSDQAAPLAGFALENRAEAGERFTFTTQSIPAGGFLMISSAELGFSPNVGDVMFLYAPGGDQVLDARATDSAPRGRSPRHDGAWLFPDRLTPGEANTFAFQDDVVINEVLYHDRRSSDEWIELYNRGDAAVDLEGWRLGGGIDDFVFGPGVTLAPGEYLVVANNSTAFTARHPGVRVLGDFTGTLSNESDQVVLSDRRGNPADQVEYFTEGRWPEAADGGGTSLELRNPRADNALAEAWSASDESGRSPWRAYSYRGLAAANVGPTRWREFVLGLLDSGEVLLDDVSVVENPGAGDRQLLQNSTFETGLDHWRVIGNHHGEVIVDPDDPTNQVLRLVATGATEHMHNHAETTFGDGASVVNGREYEISFRAKWLSGSNQLNTRLYFNRLPRTTLLERPELIGTPGARNSTFEENLGPTYRDFAHAPVVPAPMQPVTVSVTADDPDSVATMTLWWFVSRVWQSAPMQHVGGGRHTAEIPGLPAGAVVNFHVEGTDAGGAMSTFPAAGRDSRALYKVDDGEAVLGSVHNLRIIMTNTDSIFLHRDTEVMSNELRGATVIYDEREVFYDVGVRLKGSERGRPQDVRVGFIVHFDPMQRFRGVHTSIGIDRSGGGSAFGQSEILIKHIINQAGDVPGEYNDLIRVLAPRSIHTGSAMLQMARFGDVYLDSQYENGGDGAEFEYELIYHPTSTSTPGNDESLKLPQPDGVVGVSIRDLGDDKELYRWNYLQKNNRARDDYSGIIRLAKTFSLTGAAFHDQVSQVIDVDQWLRAFAALTLVGAGDNYGSGAQHNLHLYVRPSDGRVLAFPWDMDFAFTQSATSALVNNADLTKLIETPANRRLFLGHVHDVISTTYNTAYMDRWIDHYASLLPGQNFNNFKNYIQQRGDFALNQLPNQASFGISTNRGMPFSVDDVAVTIEGTGWVDLREIRLKGRTDPLPLVWTSDLRWRAAVPLAFGENLLEFEAFDFQGELIGESSITVTSTVAGRPLEDALRITEMMYNPPTGGEFGNDEYEFLELRNIGAVPLDLTDARFVDGVQFEFAGSAVTTLAPDEHVLIVRNLAAFTARYGEGFPVAGEYTGGLSNGGEHIRLETTSGATILDFTYSDDWQPATDGAGRSLVIVDVFAEAPTWNEAASWKPSMFVGGSPGMFEPLLGDGNGDGVVDLLDLKDVRNNFGGSGAGDTNGDGIIDLVDLNNVRNNFGAQRQERAPAASPQQTSTPIMFAPETTPGPLVVDIRVNTTPSRTQPDAVAPAVLSKRSPAADKAVGRASRNAPPTAGSSAPMMTKLARALATVHGERAARPATGEGWVFRPVAPSPREDVLRERASRGHTLATPRPWDEALLALLAEADQ